MAILSVTSVQPAGLTSVNPSFIYINTSDTYATVTTTGYLTQEKNNGATFSNNQMALVYTSDDGPVLLKVVITYSGSTILNTVVSLVAPSVPGSVVVPTIASHIATYTNTDGTLSEDPATAISGGNIQAGLSGTAGYLASFPSAASKGSLRLTAVANTGDTLVTISNALHGQASVYSIPDCGASTANLILSKTTGTQHITVGSLGVDAGSLASGISTGGFVGLITAYPTTATSGFIALQGAVNGSGNFGTTISNATTQAQAQVVTIPSAGAATASFILSAAAASQTISSNLSVTGGSITSGASGSAGTFISFPATAANGTLILAAANAGGAFNSTISNGTIGQSSVFTLPDPGNAAAKFLVGATATPFVSGNFPVASGTGGLMVDSGVAATNLQNKTNIKAAQVSGLGGSGAGPLTVTAVGSTTDSVIVVSILASSNTVSVAKVTPGTGDFALLLTGDPGATLTISYIMFIAAQ